MGPLLSPHASLQLCNNVPGSSFLPGPLLCSTLWRLSCDRSMSGCRAAAARSSGSLSCGCAVVTCGCLPGSCVSAPPRPLPPRRKAIPGFERKAFKGEALALYREVCALLAAGDRSALRHLVTPAVFSDIKRQLKQREDGGWARVHWELTQVGAVQS